MPLAVQHLRRVNLSARAPAVLMVHGFAQDAGTLDAPGRSLAAHLAERGFSVFVGELRGHGRSPPCGWGHGLRHHADLDVPGMLDAVRARWPEGPLLYVGHSMGGLLGVLLPAEDARRVAGLCLVCPAYRVLPLPEGMLPWLVRAARWTARWPGRLGTHWAGPLLHGARGVLDHPASPWPVPVWTPGSLEPELLRFALQQTFQPESPAVLADLVELTASGTLRGGGMDVAERLAGVAAPALLLAADRDGLVPAAGVRALARRLPGARLLELGEGVGHVDVLVGRTAPERVWPVLTGFLAACADLPVDPASGDFSR